MEDMTSYIGFVVQEDEEVGFKSLLGVKLFLPLKVYNLAKILNNCDEKKTFREL